MKLSKERRKETGAFYTPKMRAELAVQKMQKVIGSFENCVFYDPACGEGDLLEALPEECEKFGTTLEEQDVAICRKKGLRVEQLDFLSPEAVDKCRDIEYFYRARGKKLIIFTNPPYFKLKADQYPEIKSCYRTNDSVMLFYYRIRELLEPEWICGWNKMDLYQSQSCSEFRNETLRRDKTAYLMLTHSKTWGLSGSFPIAFNIIKNDWIGLRDGREPIVADVIDGEVKTYRIHRYY